MNLDRALRRAVADRADVALDASALVAASRDLARRFSRGGVLVSFGNGRAASDAQHVAVEFVHPVIVGKRALPALALNNDPAAQSGAALHDGYSEGFATPLRRLAAAPDIALGVSVDGRCQNVLRALEAARERELLTLALAGGDGGDVAKSRAVDHALVARCADALVVSEWHVTAYHLLWELAHVFLDEPAAGGPARGAHSPESLYPFLEARGDGPGATAEAQHSAAAKLAETTALRLGVIEELGPELARCALAVAGAVGAGGRIFCFGNGGSATDALALSATFLDPPRGRPLPARSLVGDAALLTALSNDVGFEVVFARQIAAFGRPGDVAVALSTSGGSENVLQGLVEARRRGLGCIGFAGYDGGRMAQCDLDHLFVVPSDSVHRIQEAQTTLYHLLWALTQEGLGAGGPACAS